MKTQASSPFSADRRAALGRSGVVLLVVLALLTLFAIVGVAFVTLSENVAINMTLNKAAMTQSRPEPDLLFSYALSQLLFESDNPNSSLWTQGLVRNMYGSGNQPYSGVGRLRTNVTAALPLQTRDPDLEPPTYGAAPLPDYPYFLDDFIHMKGRPSAVVASGNRKLLNENIFGTLASPYTYPDKNHAYLGAFTADGVVYERSFVRRPTDAAITNPHTSDVSTYYGWWTDTDPFMMQPGTGLFMQALASGVGGTPEWANAYNELRRRRAMVLRPRPSVPQFVGAGVPNPVYAPILTGLLSIGPVEGLMHPGFPVPEDVGGDVKNMPNIFQTRVWTPPAPAVFVQNDSYWVDLDFPIQTDPNTGRRYKPLFAFFIADLDGMANLNFHGNSLTMNAANVRYAPGTPQQLHASNQGWGPWEVNLARVLYPAFGVTGPAPYPDNTTPEYPFLFDQRLRSGMAAAPYTPMGYEQGRWGLTGQPGNGSFAPGLNSVSHFYGQLTYSARDAAEVPIQAAMGVNFGGTHSPSYPLTFRNAISADMNRHPSLHQLPAYMGDDRYFAPSNTEALLRHGDVGTYGLISDLRRMLPISFREPSAVTNRSARYMVTTHSFDLVRAGLSPYISNVDPDNPASLPPWQAGGGPEVPGGYPANDWANPPNTNSRVVAQQAFGKNLPFPYATNVPSGEFGPSWRPVSSGAPNLGIFSKVNLNRYLRPYPHVGTFDLALGATPGIMVDSNYRPGTLPVPNGGAYGTPSGVGQVMPAQPAPAPVPQTLAGAALEPVRFDRHPAYFAMHKAAECDRQMLAHDIYLRLLSLTGSTVPTIPAAGPTDPGFNDQLRSLRALAQLAVNIVDYIDEDDIMTPFCFYTEIDALRDPATASTYTSNDIVNPAETDPDRQIRRYWVYGTEMPRLVVNEVLTEYTPTAVPGSTFNIRTWVELASTLPGTLPANNPNPLDLRAEPLHVPAAGAQPAYDPYQIVIAGTNNTTDGPLMATANGNHNATGVWQNEPTTTLGYRAKTMPGTFGVPVGYIPQTPAPPPSIYPARVRPGQAIIVGAAPPTAGDPPDLRQSIQAMDPDGVTAGLGRVPRDTPFLPTPDMSYAVTYMGATDWQFNGTNIHPTEADPNIGITVLLRRLANPYLPPQTNPALPEYNPYVTVDYLSHIRLNSTSTATYSSRGKVQLLASGRRQHLPQRPNPDPVTATQPTVHTLGSVNSPDVTLNFAPPPFFDTFTHLDRRVSSAMELLQVSGYKPHELTQRFMTNLRTTAAIVGDPAASQTVQLVPIDTSLPFPEIRPGMVLRVGGDDPTVGGSDPTAVMEYVTVLGVNQSVSPMTITAVFAQNHPSDANNTVVSVPHGHRALWLDESRRLVRAFEWLDAVNRFQSRASYNLYPGAAVPSAIAGLSLQTFLVKSQDASNVNLDELALDLQAGAPIELRNPTNGSLLLARVADASTLPTGSVVLLVPTGTAFNAPTEASVYPHGGRTPGKINLNAVRSPEVFRALCDAQLGNSFNPPIAVLGGGGLGIGATSVTLTLPILDPSNPTVPLGVANGVSWTVQPGSYLEFRHPVNGPETVRVQTVTPAGGVIPGTPPTRQFTITFTPGVQFYLQPAHRLPYPAGAAVTVDHVSAIFDQLVLSRDGDPTLPPVYPNVARPFQGYSRGARNAITLPFGDLNPPDESLQTPYGSGIIDSLVRPEPSLTPQRRLLEVNAGNPAKGYELLAKIAGNVTSRSNVFAVWMTVGYFEVQDLTVGATVLRDQITVEMGRQNGKHVRHRCFAIVDRTVIDEFVRRQGPNYNVRDGIGNVNVLVGNTALDPRKDRQMLDVMATVLPGAPPAPYNDGLTQMVQLPGPIAAAGISFGTNLTINEGRQDVESVTVIGGAGSIIYVRFSHPPPIGGGGPRPANSNIRITNKLPRSVIHWTQIE